MGKFLILMMSGLMFFSTAAVAESTRGDRPDYQTQVQVPPRGPCLRYFLFFCIQYAQANGTYVDRNVRTPRYNIPKNKYQAIEPAMTQHLGNKGAPIMKPFLEAFRQCAPGCSYTDWGVWGDVPHQKRRSCHNSGSAIDIHAITCNGRTYRGGTGSSRFLQFRSCMHGRNGLYTIHGSGKHKQHIDIALKSCQINGVGKIQTRR